MQFNIKVSGITDTNNMLNELNHVARIVFYKKLKFFVKEELKFLKDTISTGKWSNKKDVSPQWQEFKEKAQNLYSDLPSLFKATENYVKSIAAHYIISVAGDEEHYLTQIGIIPEKTDALPIHPSWPPQFEDEAKTKAKLEPQDLEELDKYLSQKGMNIWDSFFVYLHKKIFTNFQSWVDHIAFQIHMKHTKKHNMDIF